MRDSEGVRDSKGDDERGGNRMIAIKGDCSRNQRHF